MQKDNVISVCDEALVALANGEHEAIEVIYDAMARSIYATALAITRNHADAEDATQNTILQVVKYAATYKKGSNPRAFILTVARNRALDIVRQRRSAIPLDELPIADEAKNDDEEAVLSLISPLNECERQLVILRLYEELSYNEIAKIMKISVFAAQKRYQRALGKLKSIHSERSYTDERKRDKEYPEKA